jgi:hypothetical protein
VQTSPGAHTDGPKAIQIPWRSLEVVATVKIYVQLGFLLRFAAAVALLTAVVLVGGYLAVTALLADTPHESQGGPTFTTAVTVSTIVVLVLLVAVVIAHAVILAWPFPRPRPTPIRQENRRLSEIVAAVHAAIEAGRRG